MGCYTSIEWCVYPDLSDFPFLFEPYQPFPADIDVEAALTCSSGFIPEQTFQRDRTRTVTLTPHCIFTATQLRTTVPAAHKTAANKQWT